MSEIPRLRRALLFFAVGLSSAGLGAAQDSTADVPALRVMSFNIRYRNPRDGLNHWSFRKAFAASVIRFHRADICGVQEALGRQMGQLQEQLPAYGAFSEGRDGRAGGERCGIFYRKERVELVRQATFWLSMTPERPSKSWDAALRRICTWAEMRDRRNGSTFYVFNTHFDHRGRRARLMSARLLRTKIREIAGAKPAILLGDFNCTGDSEPFAALTDGDELRDAMSISEQPHFGPRGTFPGFGGAGKAGSKIDYVFVTENVRVRAHGILTPVLVPNRVVSDHWPVVADVFPGQESVRRHIELDGSFRFSTDEEQRGRKDGFHRGDFDDSKWSTVVSGWPWELQGAEYDGVAWYRKRVRIPASWRPRRVRFVAHGIDDYYTLFVNGKELATVGSATASVWDVRTTVDIPASALRFGGENVLAWRVTDTRTWGGLIGGPFLLESADPLPAGRKKK